MQCRVGSTMISLFPPFGSAGIQSMMKLPPLPRPDCLGGWFVGAGADCSAASARGLGRHDRPGRDDPESQCGRDRPQFSQHHGPACPFAERNHRSGDHGGARRPARLEARRGPDRRPYECGRQGHIRSRRRAAASTPVTSTPRRANRFRSRSRARANRPRTASSVKPRRPAAVA